VQITLVVLTVSGDTRRMNAAAMVILDTDDNGCEKWEALAGKVSHECLYYVAE